ncbi:MAG: GxxExxY protein [Burkholderiales bacterium]|nr:GxxExxY protein [Phycisphaerae bacterium]
MRKQTNLDPDLERIAKIVVDCIFAVHSETGPGLLESIYGKCLAWEINSRGLKVQRQVVLPIHYRGQRIDDGLRIDLLVEDQIIIEVKAVHEMSPIFKTQIITYLKLSRLRLGFLVNFNQALIRDGIERIVL